MKMKKLFLLLCLVSTMCFLGGCGETGEVGFEYKESDVIDDCEALAEQMLTLSDNDAQKYMNTLEESYASGISNVRVAMEECGTFKSFSEGTLKEDGSSIEVTLVADCENRDMEIVVVIVENPAHAYDETAAVYLLEELTASPVYTMGEKMQKAASNTVMGMGVVFLVLIFISVVISFFKYIPMLFDKKAKTKAQDAKEKAASAIAANKEPVVSTDDFMNDSELVAVITAAVYEYAKADGMTASEDKLIVRSISRARK